MYMLLASEFRLLQYFVLNAEFNILIILTIQIQNKFVMNLLLVIEIKSEFDVHLMHNSRKKNLIGNEYEFRFDYVYDLLYFFFLNLLLF